MCEIILILLTTVTYIETMFKIKIGDLKKRCQNLKNKQQIF